MKGIATLLLFYFSFLAAQPPVPLVQKHFSKEDKCTMSCCQKHKKANNKTPVNNCCRDLCNPFGQYSCCIGFVVEQETGSPIALEYKNRPIQITTSGIVQGNCSDCWRPPEGIVS
jgi:hypothetical protein